MRLSTNVINVFSAKNYEYNDYRKLMFETAKGIQSVSKKEANDKIREIQFSILGLDANPSVRDIKKAIRRHRIDVYEVIEETLNDKEKLDTLIRKGFNKCDSNNSGFIEIDELWDVIGDLYDDLGMTHLTKEKVDKVMKDYDFNKDGKLSFEETKKFIIEFTKKAIESGVLDE